MYKDSAEKAEAIAFIMETISKEVLESIDDTYVSKVEFALRAGQTRTEMRATRKAENEAYRIERDAFYKDLAEENGIDPTSDLASLLRSMVYDKSKGEGDRYRRDLYAEIVSDANCMSEDGFTEAEDYDGYEGYTTPIWSFINES